MPSSPIIEAQANFAIQLLRESAASNSNASLVVSPISVAIALSMVYTGAKDETKKQISQLIAKDASEDEINRHFGGVLQSFAAENKSYTLETANRVYLKKGFPILDTFKNAITQYYEGQFSEIDFGNAAGAAKEINGFVENTTHDKIKDLIPADSITTDTRLILINAIYFKGTWLNQFDKKGTAKKTFYPAEGKEIETDMMKAKANFIYYEEDAAQVLGLPYKGEDLFMFVILPKERFGLSDMLKNLSGERLSLYVQKRSKSEVIVELPKFKIETSVNLKSALTAMGLTRVFSDEANFSAISDAEPLKVDDVFHKAFIEVAEEGTTAAASTGLMVNARSAAISPTRFYADHSFFYVIVNNDGHILFGGNFLG
jgi:serine protease inhibitor